VTVELDIEAFLEQRLRVAARVDDLEPDLVLGVSLDRREQGGAAAATARVVPFDVPEGPDNP
jgi:hypothetical protein